MPNEIKLNENEKIVDGKLHFTEDFSIKPKAKSNIVSKEMLTEAKNDKEKLVLKPRIEAIHSGRTRNDNIYPAERLKGDYQLKSGVFSFIHPYPKPMIRNHDHNSEPTGRITNAQFISDSASGKEAIIIIPEITDPAAIEKVLDGRYMTVSIGASTDAAICNICGTDVIAEGHCGHWRGETYDDVVCGWIVGNLYFDECSWVNVPADSDAKVLTVGEPTVMEAYAEINDKYYEIGEDGKKEINKQEAQVLGLVEGQKTTKEEGGKTHMSKTKEKDTVAEDLQKVTEENETLKNTITEKDADIEKLTVDLEESKTVLEETKAKLEAAEALVEEKEAVIVKKDEKIEAMDSDLAALKTKITELEGASEATMEKASEAKAEFLELLASTVVTFKEALGKPLSEEVDNLEEHLKRSEESLKDSLADLRKEFMVKKPYQQFIENPGIGARDGEGHQEIIDGFSDEMKEKLERMTPAEMMKNLFSGNIK